MKAIPNTTHTPKRIPASDIGRLIQSYIDKAEQLFYGYGIEGITPTATHFKKRLQLHDRARAQRNCQADKYSR